ncbi:NRAMP (natural resistance-associated macrophage protein)-like metal ion transporter [Arthrobacter sp. SLBN-100]|uniref:Nramp family divalent metal transporter n=1 Tax=Arthrobacter sp. SLBN-100 TaxID=2768450 RepID=UPI0011690FC5|nr:Nramp family divalent metal transporter [Arthrobacter sp. SLBN-100]TQJ69635.1 NRAMP (natural resistance-associated macrophage protein)-like metal ion transporter [Arthrobacter sp. SLBN-100]
MREQQNKTITHPGTREEQMATHQGHPAEGSTKKHRTFLGYLALMGPAFVVGAWQFGPGNLTTAVQAGSRFDYTLVWVIAVSTILMIFFTDMSVRLGIATPTSLITSIKEHLGKPVGILAGFGVFGITLMFSVGNAVGSGLGLSLIFGGSPVLWTVVCTAAVGFVLAFKNVYGIVEKALLVIVVLMGVAFIASTVVAQPDWYRSMEGLVPQLPAGSEILIVALVGTNFSINAAFYTSYGVKEHRRTRADYRDITLVDTIPGIVAPGIMTALVIMVAAAVLGKTGAEAGTINALASIFTPLAGPIGATVFALGLSGAAFSSMIANATAGGTMLSDAMGRGAKAGSPAARIVTAMILAFGLIITLSFQSSPVGLIVIAQSLTVLIAPLLGVLIVIMANKTAVMGELRNKWWHNLFAAIGLIAIIASSIRLITTLVG